MRLSVWTAHRSYSGKDRLDITIQQQDPVGRLFAPEATAFRAYTALKQAGLATLADWAAYEAAYRLHMVTVPQSHWDSLLVHQRLTLVCFCERPGFCHRRVLAELLTERGAVYPGERPKQKRGDAFE